MLLRILSGGLLAAVATVGCGGGETATNPAKPAAPPSGSSAPASDRTSVAVSSQPGLSLKVSPPEGGKHHRFTVTITTRRAAGVVGKTRTNYTAEAHAVQPASACVNDRDRRFPDAPAGARVRAALDPARGKGGPEGWCQGLFRGTVTYFEGFACPPKGTCHPPRGFPTRSRVVARFSFQVR